MELKGKKIAFLGDSITEGSGVAHRENIYWNRIAERTGAQCFGYGIGGTRIAHQKTPTNPRHDSDFCSRVDTMIPDADIVVVFGGTNDFGHGDAPFGTMTDRDNTTFYGALHTLYRKLFERYPEAQLVVMTPTHRLGEENGDWNELGVRRPGNLADYVAIIREVAAYYAIPVLDLWNVSGIQPTVPVLKERFMPDGLHPNDAGHAKIADKLVGFLTVL